MPLGSRCAAMNAAWRSTGLMPADAAATLGPALASILIYLLMAAILFYKPQGLFPARA